MQRMSSIRCIYTPSLIREYDETPYSRYVETCEGVLLHDIYSLG